MKHYAAILACFLLIACAHTAKQFNAPDHTKLDEASNRLNTAVVQLKGASAKVKLGVAAVRASHSKETQLAHSFDKPLADLAAAAPAELQPAIRQMQDRLAQLEQSQQDGDARLTELEGAQASVDKIAAAAEAATIDVNKYTPEFHKRVQEIVDELNKAQQAWAKDSAEIVKLRTGSIFAKIIGALAALAIIALIVLYFMGKITLTGARALA